MTKCEQTNNKTMPTVAGELVAQGGVAKLEGQDGSAPAFPRSEAREAGEEVTSAPIIPQCDGKRAFPGKATALREIKKMRAMKSDKADRSPLFPYRCTKCFQWHLGRRPR